MKRRRPPFFLLLLIVGCLASDSAAQQLSMRRYNVASGLAHDQVTSLLEDSRGYLWIGTFEGLSRFDGHTFVSYGTGDGIGNYLINDLAEDPNGRLWVATNGGGVSLLSDDAGATSRFTSYIPGLGGAENVNVITFDSAGRLWCGTDAGVFVADISGAEPRFTSMGFTKHAAVTAAVQGGVVWMGVNGVGLVAFTAEGSLLHPVPWSPPLRFLDLLVDRNSVLVASDTGLYRFLDGRLEPVPLTLRPTQVVVALQFDGMGGLWLATNEGLLHYDGTITHRYSLDRAIGGRLTSVLIDRGGNLWVGLGQTGVVQIKSEQIVGYTPVDGLPDADITALTEDRAGTMYAITRSGRLAVVRADGISVQPGVSVAGMRPLLAGTDAWYAIGSDGVYSIPGTPPRLDLARRLALPIMPMFHLPSPVPLIHLDDEGRLWVTSSREPALFRITNPSSSTPGIDRWPLQLPGGEPVNVIGRDRAGGVWLANMVTLARFADERLTLIETPAGLPPLQPRAFMVDRSGAVWIGLRFGGVIVTRNPAAAKPAFTSYGRQQGLASDAVWAIAEGADGRIYLGTGRGLDQLDPATGAVRHFSSDDGLAGNVVNSLHRDARGNIWAAGMGGVSRLDLSFARSRPAPAPIYISSVQLAGVSHPLPARGAGQVGDLHLRGGSRNLRIDFVTPSFQHAGRMRYQYMLQGVDSDWNAPVTERSVNYATLSPGHYRFMVRALTADGRSSETPAVVDFVIAPPFWSQPWFVATLFAGLFGGVLSVQRLRDQRRKSMAAVRRQVATDLHDDVGSGLSQIAILTELAKRKAGDNAQPTLQEVADLARSLRDSMSDIVWAINPDRDEPLALVERMRQVTFNLLPTGAEVTFQAPDDRALAGLDLAPDRRRHLLLIFKEAITNVARHAHATRVAIQLEVTGQELRLSVTDNGVGFDVARAHDGHGLESLAGRARSIGAEMEVRSRPERGATIVLHVPLRRRPRMFRWLPTKGRRS